MFVTQRRDADRYGGELGGGGGGKSHVSWEEVDLNENNGFSLCIV